MKYVGLYPLDAYTYADPTWFPDMSPELRAMFRAGDQRRAGRQRREGKFQDERCQTRDGRTKVGWHMASYCLRIKIASAGDGVVNRRVD